MKARVTVTLKSGVLDPQGKAIEGALKALGVEGIAKVRQGKVFDIELDATNRDAAQRQLAAACEKLLANLIVEDYAVAYE
jgi:phosphoribosylformylglycinamidine synthase PurS subunit